MTLLSNKEYKKKLRELCADGTPEYPNAYYDAEGDCIEAMIKQGRYYAERIDDLVSVYCSEENDEIVGCLIKGVKKIFEREPKTKIILHAGRIRLADFFLVGFMTQKKANIVTYQRLKESLADIETDIECCLT